jgi:hypothetical protein
MAFLTRFCQSCPFFHESDNLVFTSLNFATVIFYSARSPALHLTPNLEDQASIFMSPRDRVDQFYPQALGSFFVTFYNSKGYSDGVILTSLHMGYNESSGSKMMGNSLPS